MRRPRLSVRALLAACVLVVPTVAGAQTALGSIAGTVRDTTGAVLPGVTVEASSPALIEKVRVAQTDGEGRYQIIQLSPGAYIVTFTLEGFNVVRREGVELNTGFTATINADLQVGSVSETITVSGQSPVVDLQNTKQQVVVTRDVIDSVPTGRSFQNIAVLIPGAVGDGVVGSPVNQDVGGGSGQSFMRIGIHGGRSTDQRIDLDGMSTSAWTRPDSSAIVFTDGNIEEYNISYAASSAEQETGGLRINLIPREGANAFRGRFFGNYSVPDWQANNLNDSLRSRGLTAPNKLKSVWSVNPTLGGPIKKDKLWFFATYTYSVTDTLVADNFQLKDPTAWVYDPDRSKQGFDDQFSKDISTRLTYQASPRNKFAGYLSYNNTCHCHFLIGRANSAFNVNFEASTFLNIPNKVGQITWTSPVTSKLLLEAGYSNIVQNQQFDRQPESTAAQITDIGLSVIYRGTISSLLAYTPVQASRFAASYVTGSHSFKFGYSATWGYYDNTSRRTGDELTYLAINGVPLQVTYAGTPTLSTNRIRPNLGVFAQDQWSMNRLTVNLGIRFDYLRNDYPDQTVAPTKFVPITRSFPGLEAVNWKDLNPRFGASYDLFGNGKTAIKVTANRFIQGEGVGRAQSINPITANNTATRAWTDLNNNRIVDADPLNLQANGELGRANNLNFGKPIITFRYDRDWSHGFGKRPYNWEFSTGVQQEIVPRVSANFAFFRRIYGNFPVTDNLAVSRADFTPYCVTAPTDSRLSVSGQQVCGLFDLNPAKLGQIDQVGSIASKYGNQYEHWNGIDLTMNARLPKLLLQGGISTGRTFMDYCDVSSKVDSVTIGTGLVAITDDRFCQRESPFLTQLKLLGALTLPYDIQLSGTYQNAPGPNVTALGSYVNAQVLGSLGRTLTGANSVNVELIEPMKQYGERLNQLDFRVAKRFQIDRYRLMATFDLYNATNNNTVLVQSNNYGATTGATTGSTWLRPQAILPARIVKFSAQLDF